MSDAQSIYDEANKLIQEQRLDQAVEKLQAALEIDPDHVLTLLALSRWLSVMGRHDEAVRHGVRACELDDKDPIHFTVLSVTYQRALAGTGNMEYMQLAEQARDRAHALTAQQ